MNNAYSVLGINQDVSDDDVKRAYRDLARKYHPDNYVNHPLADLAEVKMKEINEAYDTITKERAAKATGGNYSSDGGAGARGGYQYTGIRKYIEMGDLKLAEEMLAKIPIRNAEWHFLMGSIYFKKGWLDKAREHVHTAHSLDPTNFEYRTAYTQLSGSSARGYRGGSNPGGSGCDCCANLICLDCCCECMGGDLISCC